MTCDHRLIQKQWMLGQIGYEDSCPECDKKRIAELEGELSGKKAKVQVTLVEKDEHIAELEKENAGLVEESGIDLVKYEEQLAEKNARLAELGRDVKKGLDYGLQLEDRIVKLEKAATAVVEEIEEVGSPALGTFEKLKRLLKPKEEQKP